MDGSQADKDELCWVCSMPLCGGQVNCDRCGEPSMRRMPLVGAGGAEPLEPEAASGNSRVATGRAGHSQGHPSCSESTDAGSGAMAAWQGHRAGKRKATGLMGRISTAADRAEDESYLKTARHIEPEA